MMGFARAQPILQRYGVSREKSRLAIKFRNAAAMPHNSAKASAAPTNSSAIAASVCGALHGAKSFTAAAAAPIPAP